MYTFLAIAPCNFTVNGKHYSAEAGTPIQVGYNEALIMSSPTFRYRSYLRVITPIEPPKVEPESSKTIETTEQVITSTQPLDSPETIEPIEPPEVKAESVEPKPSRKSRSKKEELTTELKEEIQINTEVMNLF